LSNRYELTTSDDGLSYQFSSASGDVYYAYFTLFFLQNKQGEEIEIFSFGFDRKETGFSVQRGFDPLVKATIQHILLDFFKQNHESAAIYVCLTTDGKARNRKITFAKWFNELADDFVKFDSYTQYEEDNFYSSIIIAKNNPYKNSLIEAYYYSLDYWMGSDS
jgi:hypothetical protein